MVKIERIEWLALLRGLNILLVVMFHVQLIDMSTGHNHSFCSDICLLFNPIRMPLFIFTSGGLLYLSRIRKNIQVKELYYDKFKRIMIPFFFFVIVYYAIKLLFSQFTKTPTELSLDSFLECFIYFRGNPSASLWFLAVLMLFMLLYPLYRYLCQKPYLMVVFMLFCCVFYFVDYGIEEQWNIFFILNIQYYLVYFFFGIFFFRFELYNYLNSFTAILLLIITYIATCFIHIPLLCSLIGILMMCAITMKIAQYYPHLFSSFREYIFQIYLMSLPFQGFVELVLWKRLFYNENLFLLFYVLNVLSGILIPVLIAKYIERCNIKFIRLCFGLK